MADFFAGLTGLMQGFNERHQQYRAEQMQLEHERNQRESAIYNTLLQSNDPAVRSMAATGLVTSALGPSRKSGIRGWIGDMSTNPMTEQIQRYMTETTTTPAALPSRAISGVASQAPGTAGEVSTQTTRAGQPGPEPTHADTAIPFRTAIPPTVAQPPPTAAGQSGMNLSLQQGALSRPQPTTQLAHPFAFPTLEEQMASRYRGQYAGEIEGIAGALMAGGMSQQEAYATARDHFMRSRGVGAAGGLQLVHGKDAHGVDVSGMFDKRPGSPTYGQVLHLGSDEPIEGFVATSTQQRMTDRWQITQQVAQERGENPQQLSPAGIEEVNRRIASFTGEKAGASATSRQTALAGAPLTREETRRGIHEMTTAYNTATAGIRTARMAQDQLHAAIDRYDADPNTAQQQILTAVEQIMNRQSGVPATDYARTPQGQPLLDRLQAWLDRQGATGGQGMTKENALAAATTADALVAALEPWRQMYRRQTENEARAGGFSEEEIRGVFGEPPAAVGTQPPTAAASAPAAVSPAVGTQPPSAGPRLVRDAKGNWVVQK